MDVTKKTEIIEQFLADMASPKSVRTDSGEVEQHDLLARKKAIEWGFAMSDEIEAEAAGRRRGIVVGQIRNIDHM